MTGNSFLMDATERNPAFAEKDLGRLQIFIFLQKNKMSSNN